MFAGGLGQFIASPTDLVKVQMQMEGRRRSKGSLPGKWSWKQAKFQQYYIVP